MQLDRLLVLRMLAEHAQRRRAARRRAARLPLRRILRPRTRSRSCRPVCRTRYAENGRRVRDDTNCSRSVLPVASSFCICARSIGRCRIMRPERKSQVLSGPDRFLADVRVRQSRTRAMPHFGHGPSGSWPLKSGASPSSSSPVPSPKSNSTSLASLSLSLAENGRPSLLRKPSSGPTSRSRQQRLGFGGLELAAGDDLPEAKSHDWHWNFLYFSWTSPPHFGQRARRASRSRRGSCRSRSSSPAPTMCCVISTISRMNCVALQLAVLHLRELEFPLGGELGREQLRHAEAVQQRHQRKRLRRRLQLACLRGACISRRSGLR